MSESHPAPERRPAVSVVMAVYNGEPYVGAAVESVLQQTFTDFEFVIVDDCSTDRTAEIIAAFGDPRIVYRRNERNLGQTASLNRGLGYARADLIARIDADDLFYPTKLERQVAVLGARPDVAVLGTACRVIDEDGNVTGLVVPPQEGREVLFRLCYGVPVVHISIVARAEALRAVDGYDTTFRYSQDYALWSTLVRKGYRIANITEPLAAFRERSDSVNAVNKLGDAAAETCRIAQRNARELAGVDVTLEQARAVDLLMFPIAGLTHDEIASAIHTLKAYARGVWRGPPPLRVRASLAARLTWATVKVAQHDRASEGGATRFRGILRSARRRLTVPDEAAALFLAWILSAMHFQRVGRLKAVATRYLLR
jgi:hypothetical protein